MLKSCDSYRDYAQYSLVKKFCEKVGLKSFYKVCLLVLVVLFFSLYYCFVEKLPFLILFIGSVLFFVLIDIFYLACFLPFSRNFIYKISFLNKKLSSKINNQNFMMLEQNGNKSVVFLFLPDYIDIDNDDGVEDFNRYYKHKFWQALALVKEITPTKFVLAHIRIFGFFMLQVFYILIVMLVYMCVSMMWFIKEFYVSNEVDLVYLFVYMFIFVSVSIFIYYFRIIMTFKQNIDVYHRKYTSLSRLDIEVYDFTKSRLEPISTDIVIKRTIFYTNQVDDFIEHYINFIAAILLVTLLTTIFIKT